MLFYFFVFNVKTQLPAGTGSLWSTAEAVADFS